MIDDSAAQDSLGRIKATSGSAWPEVGIADSALLEEALQEAIEAHAAGLLAAPFGVDEIALLRARRRALLSDLKQVPVGGLATSMRQESA